MAKLLMLTNGLLYMNLLVLLTYLRHHFLVRWLAN